MVNNFIDIMGSNPNLMIAVRAEDLMEANRQLIRQTLEEARIQETDPAAEAEEELISRKDFMSQYNVSGATLWRWQKIGYIVPRRLGTRVYFL